MVREGFAAVLAAQPGLVVVGQAADGADAVRQTRHLRPDVVLMDVRMPVMDGLQATRQILGSAAGPERPRVLMLTTFDLDDYVYEALRAGASGFLLKDATAAELVHAVRVVAAGDALLAPAVTRRLIADFARQPRPDPPFPAAPGALTHRESEVLRLIARGLSNTEISDTLVIAAADDQDLRRPHPGQAGPPRPGPGRRLRLRNRPRHARRIRPGRIKPGHRAPAMNTHPSPPVSAGGGRGRIARPADRAAGQDGQPEPRSPAGRPDSAAGIRPALIEPAWPRAVEAGLT